MAEIAKANKRDNNICFSFVICSLRAGNTNYGAYNDYTEKMRDIMYPNRLRYSHYLN